MPKVNSMYVKLAKLFGGVAIAQAIVFLATPILAKLYGPESFGLFGTFFTISSLLAIIFSLRVDLVISKSQDSCDVEQALSIFLLGLVFFLPACLLVSLFYSYFISPISLSLVLYCVVGGIVFAFFNLSYAFLVYQECYTAIAKQKVMRALITVAIQFTLVAYLQEGLIVGTLVSYLVTSLIFWNVKPYLRKLEFTVQQISSAYKNHKEIIKFNTLSDVANFVSQQLPMFIAMTLGSSVVAPYFLAERLVRTPIYLIAQSVRPMIMRQLVAASNISQSYFRIVAKLVVLAISLTVIAYVAIYLLFKYFNFPGWQNLDLYLYLITAWAMASLVNTATTPFLTIIKKSSVLFKLEVSALTIKAGGVFLFYLYDFTFVQFIFLFSGFSVFWYCVIFVVCFSKGRAMPNIKVEEAV
ncbi:hypothetical protein [Vibrio europaeus]|uniref:hypothetical protein n=1 Tax=Vibrio europaeus TaxID=300876 RepID=UPI00148C0D58|nr:hypothetical protein [Vibrio europaeus]NOH24990.1 hypothetical protein [Vibrio europaeus]